MEIQPVHNESNDIPSDPGIQSTIQLNANLFKFYDHETGAPSLTKLNAEITNWMNELPRNSSIAKFLSTMQAGPSGEYITCEPGSTELTDQSKKNLVTIGGAVWGVNQMIGEYGSKITSMNQFAKIPPAYLHASRINFEVRHLDNKYGDHFSLAKGFTKKEIDTPNDLICIPENPPPIFDDFVNLYLDLIQGFNAKDSLQFTTASNNLCLATMPHI
ncbi:MAG: hypothetical protein SP1CHLAM54_11730 [Chlamydiia bacterium]|nr:hypothetical protein [Chlamydiia bacterium]MCH9616076.1 hypothetical protein [Chlamydiia bacterium]MCH9629099.1 hypothetical protein [Chlamydiia bacterium]